MLNRGGMSSLDTHPGLLATLQTPPISHRVWPGDAKNNAETISVFGGPLHLTCKSVGSAKGSVLSCLLYRYLSSCTFPTSRNSPGMLLLLLNILETNPEKET